MFPYLKKLAKKTLPDFIYSPIHRHRWLKHFKNYQPTLQKQRFGDYEFVVKIVDPLGQRWYGHDWAMPPEILLLQTSRLKPGAVVFDLGAHQCVMAMLLSRAVGPDGFVLAVEGSLANSKAGMRNVQLNSITNCKVIHGAVSARAGTLSFDALGNGSVVSEHEVSKPWLLEVVTAYSIDDLASEYLTPDVVYVDVEGHECEVLKGASKVLASRPDWFIEVHQGAGLEKYGGSREKLLSFFDDYRFYVGQPTVENDFASWNEFKLADEFGFPSDRFYLVAIPNRPINSIL